MLEIENADVDLPGQNLVGRNTATVPVYPKTGYTPEYFGSGVADQRIDLAVSDLLLVYLRWEYFPARRVGIVG
ncbi:hypothetical protein [Spirosoma panaciterrae]|uniref:hypothetical protein n=1 Tax=Spirosoma panaciterrae TaxID=496058 RepID=UPI00035FF2B0|nr:hypothetical protein [Spirosoma panaciterrae]